MFKKTLLTAIIASVSVMGLQAGSLAIDDPSVYKWSISEQDRVSSSTKIQNIEKLVNKNQEISVTILKLEELQERLRGYEEREIVVKLTNHFKQKYLIEETDILSIKNNLNKSISEAKRIIKENQAPVEEPGIFGLR